MLSINGVTRGPRDYSFSFSELKQEAAKRGIHLSEPVTKANLINALFVKERVLQRKDLVVYGTERDLVVRDLTTFDSTYSLDAGRAEQKKVVGFFPYIVGITSKGEIVTLGRANAVEVAPYLRVFNSKLELLREKRVADTKTLRASSSIVP